MLAQIGKDAYGDAAGGKSTTEQVIAGGADIVFGQGDGSSFGMLQAVETATPPAGADKVWFIDVIGDKTGPIDDPRTSLLSSVLWNFAGTFKQAIADIDAGTFGNAGYVLDLANGGISLLQTDNITPEALGGRGGGQGGHRGRPHHRPGDRRPWHDGRSAVRGRARRRMTLGASPVGRDRTSATRPTAVTPTVELIEITKAFPGVIANDHISLAAMPGEVLCLLGRERRRQVDPDEHPLRALPARQRAASGSMGARSASTRPGTVASWASAWSTSTSASSRRSPCSRT